MAYEQILYSVEDKVLTLTLNRAERLNAFTGVMCRTRSTRSIAPTPTIRCAPSS